MDEDPPTGDSSKALHANKALYHARYIIWSLFFPTWEFFHYMVQFIWLNVSRILLEVYIKIWLFSVTSS